MTVRVARCRCGQLTAICRGEPVRVSVCHCIDCQRRTGGPFSAQARFPREAVTIAGTSRIWEQVGGSGRRACFHWCDTCGGTVFWINQGAEETVAVPIGTFAEGDVPVPTVSIFEERRQPWVRIEGEGITHLA